MKNPPYTNKNHPEIKKYIEEIEYNYPNIDDMRMTFLVNQLLEEIPITLETYRGGSYFRGRINNDDKLFTNIKEIWCPPKSMVKIGRLNRPKEPMFYTGGHFGVVYREIKPKLGETITFGTFKASGDFALAELGLIPHYSGKGLYKKAFWSKRAIGNLISYNHDNDLLKINQEINRILNYHLRKEITENPEEGYQLSSILASSLMDSTFSDGIIYPSVSSDLKDLNIVLKPNRAMKKLQLINIDVFKHIEKGLIPIAGSNKILPNGDIIYNGIHSDFPGLSSNKAFRNIFFKEICYI